MVGTLSLTRVAEKSLPTTHRSTYGEQNTTQDCHPRRSALLDAILAEQASEEQTPDQIPLMEGARSL